MGKHLFVDVGGQPSKFAPRGTIVDEGHYKPRECMTKFYVHKSKSSNC